MAYAFLVGPLVVVSCSRSGHLSAVKFSRPGLLSATPLCWVLNVGGGTHYLPRTLCVTTPDAPTSCWKLVLTFLISPCAPAIGATYPSTPNARLSIVVRARAPAPALSLVVILTLSLNFWILTPHLFSLISLFLARHSTLAVWTRQVTQP